MKYIIDRFEDNFAVVELENKQFVSIPRGALPREAKEGDIIIVTIDQNETRARKEHIDQLIKNVWAN